MNIIKLGLIAGVFGLLVMSACSQNTEEAKRIEKPKPLQGEIGNQPSKEDLHYLSIYLEEHFGGLIPKLSNGKWGFQDLYGEQVISPVYDAIRKDIYYQPRATYIILKKNNRWGVVDIKGKEVIPFEYEDISTFSEDPRRLLVKTKAKWGLMDVNGKFIVDAKCDRIGGEVGFNSLIRFRQNGKEGFVNVNTGVEEFPPIYDYLGELNNGYLISGRDGKAGLLNVKQKTIVPFRYESLQGDFYTTIRAKLNGKWGVVDTAGKEVFPFRYDAIDFYSLEADSGTARVQINKKIGVVDRKGKEIIPLVYDWIFNQDGMHYLPVKIGEKLGVINNKGEIVVKVKYEDLQRDYGGAFFSTNPPTKVKLNGKWGYLDSTGKEVTPFKYDAIEYTYSPMIAVLMGNKWGFINTSGKEITSILYDKVEFKIERSSFICIRNEKYGMLDQQGNEITSFIYDQMKVFDEYSTNPRIAVQTESKWGFIDKNGQVLMPPQFVYDEIKPFSEGLAAVSKEGRWGYINKQGVIIVPIKYEAVSDYFENGKASVSINGKWGVINKKGTIIVPIEYGEDPLLAVGAE